MRSRAPVRATASSPREGGNLIAKIHQLGGRVFARILKAHGVDELNPAQGRIIYELWKEDRISQAQLAARTRLDKSTLTLMLDRLETQGQLRRESDPRDARRRIVTLTASNRAMHAAYARASKEMTGIFYRDITDDEIDAFEATLRTILRNLEAAESHGM